MPPPLQLCHCLEAEPHYLPPFTPLPGIFPLAWRWAGTGCPYPSAKLTPFPGGDGALTQATPLLPVEELGSFLSQKKVVDLW